MSSTYSQNSSPSSDCWQRSDTEYSSYNNEMNSWYLEAADARNRVTSLAPSSADAATPNLDYEDEITRLRMKSLDEEAKTSKNVYKHVPHKDRPPLIVARRNARERRRVQAVNTAFMKLRKIVPIVNNRGKRISKVKTLQTAIDYISGLQALLKQADVYHNIDIISEYRYQEDSFIQDFEEFEPEF